MIADEKTLHTRPNYTEINNYRSPYGLQQWAKHIPYIQLQKALKWQCKSIQTKKLGLIYVQKMNENKYVTHKQTTTTEL